VTRLWLDSVTGPTLAQVAIWAVLAGIAALAVSFFGPRLARRSGTPRWASVLMLLLAIALVAASFYFGARSDPHFLDGVGG